MGGLFSSGRNEQLEAIERRHREEAEARRHAEEEALKAERARLEAERAQLEAERLRLAEAEAARQAREAMDEANRRAERERQERERAEQETRNADQRAQQGEENARRERERAEEERREREQAEKRKKEAEEAMERARVAREEAEVAAEKARIKQEESDKAAQEAMEEMKKAKDDLANGIQPVTWPTPEEYARTLKAYQYQEGKFHFAIAGLSGSGKSSLVNAFRGLLNQAQNAAATGFTETTMVVGRYPDPNPDKPCIWYDVPGAGTLTIKDWDYFNKQGLYIFDAIIVLFDNRFTATDIAILRNCERWKIPAFIVRSKSDQQVENIKETLADSIGEDESLDEDERESRLETVLDVAIEEYKSQTRQSVKKNLKDSGLEDQEVYLVSYKALLNTIRRNNTRNVLYLDEATLLTKLVEAAKERRCPPASQQLGESSGGNKSVSMFARLTGSGLGKRSSGRENA
ncbi:P-loop containing nucleoside triphosphate hydrolase protein [Dendrothele bispora CBS 962.96]|uniref:P-loop containing nucleoside triphosphate hydrolase protein n=1 Tax=Dendrothele bispora (strain CBS 962.96) TaxID=1314807 RepID=A0A4S8L8H1_DENBC|nr:P-loop containing nucleoside triphosphate hydrolase protein [Dendrothele bispora CBS 962.96]